MSFDMKLSSALNAVVSAQESHMQGEDAPLSISVLVQVQKELENMRSVMDPKVFKPGYPRFLLDWSDETGLVDMLSELAYVYGKLRGSRGG